MRVCFAALSLLLLAAAPSREGDLARMLRDPNLFGPDARAVLESLPAFDAAGEKEIAILDRRVAGETRYRDRDDAARAATAAREMRSPVPLSPIVFPDDRTIRLGSADAEVRYLATPATLENVERTYGPAERVTTEQLLDGTMRRPIELTLHRFAHGALVIATSNLRPDPSDVDRVFLDVKAAMRVLGQERAR
jgi:hypothetical protein